MALANYDDLVDAISEYLLRDDRIPDFIRLAELRAERETNLRQRWTETEVKALTLAENSTSIPLPTGMIEIRWVRFDTNPTSFLRIVGPERFDEFQAWYEPGVPRAGMHLGLDLMVAPIPDSDYIYDIIGYSGITPLTDTAQTNWLMTNAPDVYLYGALRESSPYLRKPEELGMYQALSDQALKSLNRQEKRARLGGGRLRMRPDVWTP